MLAIREDSNDSWTTAQLDNEDDLEEVKKKYDKLKREKREDELYVKNLQKKLDRLRTDLDARTEAVEDAQRTLAIEENKKDDEEQSRRRERSVKAIAQEDRIRECLSEVLYAKPSSREDANIYELDTVVVSYIPAREGRTVRYNLAFRVDGNSHDKDRNTSVRELRASACRYWNAHEEDYVLKTMAGNKCQDDIKVSDCFRQGELAQLRLEPKDCDPIEKPTDDEWKAVMGRGKKPPRKGNKKNNDTFDVSVVEQARKQQDSRDSDMKMLGGTYFLLKKRESKATEHRSKIMIRDMIMYGILLFLTFYSYLLRRPASDSYWCRKGFEDYLSRQSVTNENKTVPRFRDLEHHEEVYDWLQYTFVDIFYGSQTPLLGDFNALLGYVAIRVQNVRHPNDQFWGCSENRELVDQLSALGAHCKPNYVNEESQQTGTYADLRSYWDNVTAKAAGKKTSQLRGHTDPYTWRSAELNFDNHSILSYSGHLQTYDASGYMAEYRMNLASRAVPATDFREDLARFRTYGWLASNTRALFLSFTAYNFDYDLWVWASLHFELPDSGVVIKEMKLVPFQPQMMETRAELQETYMDYARVAIALAILILVGQNERHHKIKHQEAGCWYHVSLNGICDIGIVLCIFIGTIWRRTLQGGRSTATWIERVADEEPGRMGELGFYSMESMADQYQRVMVTEGLLMVFIMYRMISFFRINRIIYLLWHSLGLAWKGMIFFSFLLLPTICGFTYLLHIVYGPYTPKYASLPSTLLAVYQMTDGAIDIRPLVQQEKLWALIILILFYVVVKLILGAVFATLVIDGYYVAHLVDGGPGEKFRWRKWAVPNVVWSIFQKFRNQSVEES